MFESYLSLKSPSGKIFLFLDEIQFFKDWQVFVKDLYEKGGVKIFLTGSNSQLISEEMSSLLSGRALVKNIKPFNFKEMVRISNIKLNEEQLIVNNNRVKKIFDDFLSFGGFPEIVLEQKQYLKKEILNNYYKNILYQDIVSRFSIKKSDKIESLLIYILSNIGKPYSYNSLSKIINVSDKTIKEYMSYFRYSLMIFELNNFHYSLKKQEKLPKKAYSIDNGFINTVSFSMQEDYGRALENLIFISLLNSNYKLFYYSQRNKGECDFIVKEKNKIIKLIQVTKILNADNEKREIKGLLSAMEEFNLKKGYIITKDQEELRVVNNKEIRIIPAYKWLIDEVND